MKIKKYEVVVKIDEQLEYEAENEQEAIDNAKDWIEKQIDRAEFFIKRIE